MKKPTNLTTPQIENPNSSAASAPYARPPEQDKPKSGAFWKLIQPNLEEARKARRYQPPALRS